MPEARKAAGSLQLPAAMLIDGEWRDSASGEVIDVVNPYTDEVIGTVPAGDSADVAQAVSGARKAFADGP